MPKQKRPSPTKSDLLQAAAQRSRPSTNPRRLNQQQRTLMALYSNGQQGMTPEQFYSKWQVTQLELAAICSRSISTVQCWFAKGRSYRRPTSNDLRHLALMDFLLEHFEEIPQAILNLLCPPR